MSWFGLTGAKLTASYTPRRLHLLLGEISKPDGGWVAVSLAQPIRTNALHARRFALVTLVAQ